MDENRNPQEPEREGTPSPTPDVPHKTSRRTRIFALLAALLMIALVLVYTYSIASGKIFAW